MRVLVTGGAGYIGSVVSDVLLNAGHDVIVLDNLTKGWRDAVPAGATFVKNDLKDLSALHACLTSSHVDAVVHMAADSLVGESVPHPARYYRNNLIGGLGLLDTMRQTGVARIVFSSSAAVYGNPDKQPIDEADPAAPTNPYGETKLAFERALAWYGDAYDLKHVSLRYFNAAGAAGTLGERHDPETHLIPLVLNVAAGRAPAVRIFGDDYPTRDGTCVRDYVHVSDIANAHLLALEALADTDSVPAQIFNIGCGGTGYTVREVISAAERITGERIPVEPAPRRAGDPAVLIADPSKIAAELGWRPRQQSLEEIIGSAWRWMLSR